MDRVIEGSGRTHVVVKGGGGPKTTSTASIDARKTAQFQSASEVLDMNLDVEGEAPFTRGQVEILASVADATPAQDTLTLEVNVLGILGTAKTVIARFAFSSSKSQARLAITEPWDALGFEFRQNVNGAGNSSVVPLALGFTATGRFYRE